MKHETGFSLQPLNVTFPTGNTVALRYPSHFHMVIANLVSRNDHADNDTAI